jgi:hypothetical protein
MARKANSQKQKREGKTKSSSRPIWKGSLDFGLVSIPVALYPAQATERIDFDLIDKRDFSRIRYLRVIRGSALFQPFFKFVHGVGEAPLVKDGPGHGSNGSCRFGWRGNFTVSEQPLFKLFRGRVLLDDALQYVSFDR